MHLVTRVISHELQNHEELNYRLLTSKRTLTLAKF